MKERPILMSAPMVRALLAGRKTVTRRLDMRWAKAQPGERLWVRETWASNEANLKRPGRVAYDADGKCGCWVWDGEGDVLFISHGRVLQASGYSKCFPDQGADTVGLAAFGGKWRPSIFMPRWACRLTRPLLNIRVEALHAITEEDAVAEGLTVWESAKGAKHYGIELPDVWEISPRMAYARLWDTINPKAPWVSNPSVVRLEFGRMP